MKHVSNKSNIDILKDYVAGIRPFTQVSMYQEDTRKYRKEGEKWTDKDGIEWQKKNGRVIKLTKSQADFIRELIQEKCKCGQIISWGTKRDVYFFRRTGLCENCLIEYETKLRIVGVYPDYEKYKLLSYELGTLKDIKEKIVETVDYFSKERGDIMAVCNSEGFVERWKNTNRTTILEDAKKDLKLARKKITEVSKLKDKFKKLYQDGAKKFKLDFYV